MKTELPSTFSATSDGQQADAILRSCVHCGFCNATCPTYQLLGDELDGPRGRIYLIKEMLEERPVSQQTRQHLDRCLTCRACETTCPSGVQYARLLDIGRQELEKRVRRPARERWLRRLLGMVLPYRNRFRVMLRLGHQFRRYLPDILKPHIPEQLPVAVQRQQWPAARHARHMILLDGCVQPVLQPGINLAAARVLDRLGISLQRAEDAGCCGAVSHHLADSGNSHEQIRRNISAWWPHVENGAEAIVSTSSACSAMLKEYAYLMRDDPEYAEKAAHLASITRDIAEIVAAEPLPATPPPAQPRVAFQAPCSAQHGQQLDGPIGAILTGLGFELTPVADGHLCCGAAGTYSVLQPDLSERLRANKLASLQAGQPDCIATANIGCQIHLQRDNGTPVRHWIELVDERLATA